MDSRKRKPEDETTHTGEAEDPEEGTSGGPPGPSPPKQARKEMALKEAVDLLEKMLAQEEGKLGDINLGDPLFTSVDDDEPIKTLEEIIREGDDVVGAHQLIVKQTKLRMQRNRQAVNEIIKKQLSDIKTMIGEAINKLEQGVQSSYLLLDKLNNPFQKMKCIYELANEQFGDTPVAPEILQKFKLCLRDIVEYTAKSSPRLERGIREKLRLRALDVKFRVLHTCQKYIVMAMQNIGGPKTVISEEKAKLYVQFLAHYDDMHQANQDGINLIKLLDNEQTDVVFHKNNFDTLLTTIVKMLANEGNQKIDEAMLGLHTPINMISDALKTLIVYIIDETVRSIYADPTKDNDEIVHGLKPKARIVVNEYYATIMVSSEQMKFYSLDELRNIVQEKISEEKYPVVSGVLPENVPGADIPLASVVIQSDTEDEGEQESEADEEEQETETGDEGAETQAEETEEGTDETDIEGTESETQVGSEAQPETESETQVEQTEGETEEGEESELEMTVIKYAKPHVKEEEGAGPSSKSQHPMQTRSKTDK
ncbi:Ja156 [Japanese cytomegalovirus]|nr:Ja156 [Japanese cytomegalovirus]